MAKPWEMRMRGSEGRSKATWNIITSASALQQVAEIQQATHQACFLHMQDIQGRNTQCISPWKRRSGWGGEVVICSDLSHLLLPKDPDSPYGELTPLNFQIVSSGPTIPEPVCGESTIVFYSSPKVMWHGQGAIKRMEGWRFNSVQLNILSTGLKTNQNYLFKLLWDISPITKNTRR